MSFSYGSGYDNGHNLARNFEQWRGDFRGKTIFDSSQTIHVWAQQSQPVGRNAKGTIWFREGTLFSYSTPIAKFALDAQGNEVVLLSSRTYSVTTSKQQGTARHAVRGKRVYLVDNVESIDASIRDLIRKHDNAVTQAANKRKRAVTRLAAAKSAECALQAARELADVFNERRVTIPVWNAAWSDDVEALAEKHAADIAQAEKLRKEREAEALKRALKEFEEDRPGFLSGALTHVRNGHMFDCLLAVSADRETIRTSWGAGFPASHGIRALRLICAVRKAGRNWQRNGAGPRLGHFTIDAVGADGTVKAGCHTVPWSSIEHAAKILNVA